MNYGYDALGRLVGSTLSYGVTTSSTAITYDPADNRSSVQVGLSGSSAARMTAATVPNGRLSAGFAVSSATPRAGPGVIAPYLSKFKKPITK